MADYVDVQFATLIGGRYERFKIKHQNPLKINFRCPVCGDSQKSKSKARGWITEIPATGHLHYTCFNCGFSKSLGGFIKEVDPSVYNDYIAEKYVNKTRETKSEDTKIKNPKFNKNPLKELKKISQLKYDHPAKKYVESRKIPSNQHYRIYYVSKFMKWINGIIPGKFGSDLLKNDEPRLIIPLMDKDKRVFGVSARAFNPKSLRYITIMFDDSPKIFGLDTVDFDKTYFVTEGAIDAMFIKNSIAMIGADIKMEGLFHFENAIFVHDAEPRNKQICDRMERLIDSGHKVCIWPSNVLAKDINEMHLKGMKDIEKVILENTYQGLLGKLKMKEWRKC